MSVFKQLENQGFVIRKLPTNAQTVDCIIIDPQSHTEFLCQIKSSTID